MPPGIQRYPRTKMVLPLRVWTDEAHAEAAAALLAHTLDISPIGGRLGGLHTQLNPGQTILLQRGQKKLHFRVVWSKQIAPSEIQAGIEILDTEKKIWGVDLPSEVLHPQTTGSAQAAPVRTIEYFSSKPGSSPSKPVPPATRPPHRHAKPAVSLRTRWIAAVAMFLVVVSTVLAWNWISRDSQPMAMLPPLPLPPGVPRFTKPLRSFLSRTIPSPPSRLQVSEAPEGRVVYPVPPDEGLRGNVDLKVVIAADGHVKQIQLLNGKQLLAEAAAQAVRLWHYSQHQLNGEAVEAETKVTVSFLGNDAVSIRFPTASGTDPVAN